MTLGVEQSESDVVDPRCAHPLCLNRLRASFQVEAIAGDEQPFEVAYVCHRHLQMWVRWALDDGAARCLVELAPRSTTPQRLVELSSFRAELLAERDAKRAERAKRDEDIVATMRAGASLRVVADKFGLTRQRCAQIAARAGAKPVDLQRERSEARRRALGAARLRACKVCGSQFDPWNGRVTCSDACRYVWKLGRRYLDETRFESERQTNARFTLAHPERYDASQLRYAERVVAGQPPRRRWHHPGSKLAQAFRDAGVEFLLPPASSGGWAKLEHRCSATTQRGEPCSRHVANDGDLCHVHRGVTTAALRAKSQS